MPDQGQISSRDQLHLVECLRAVGGGEKEGGGEGEEEEEEAKYTTSAGYICMYVQSSLRHKPANLSAASLHLPQQESKQEVTIRLCLSG